MLMDNTFGCSGSTRAIGNDQWVVEREALEEQFVIFRSLGNKVIDGLVSLYRTRARNDEHLWLLLELSDKAIDLWDVGVTFALVCSLAISE